MKKMFFIVSLLSFCSAVAAGTVGPAWAWDAGKITNNGSIQIKSTNGTSTYTAVQNPTGAVAKANQSALTQPPTVIIQATSAAVFNFKDDCYIFQVPSGYVGGTSHMIGAGKIDSSVSPPTFTGLFSDVKANAFTTGGMFILSMLTGMTANPGTATPPGGGSIGAPVYCGSDITCAASYSFQYQKTVIAAGLQIQSVYSKCFP